jgi:hypothetical protein
MRSVRHLSLLLCLLGAATAVHAQKLTPGLWENTITLKSGDGRMDAAMARMQEELAKMPPEQRKQMEAMMANRGVAMGGAGGAPNAIRICMSKEQAERNEVPQGSDGRCKRDSLVRSGSTLKFKVTCSEPQGTGEGSFNFSSDKAYSGNMVMNVTREGRAMRMEIQQDGKWLSADCGTLKPRQ